MLWSRPPAGGGPATVTATARMDYVRPLRRSNGMMISVRDLRKQFGSTTAVDGLSFEVQRGEVVGFLGPNGAGKTTTIRVLTCFHPASSGDVRVAGFDVRTQPLEVRKNIGYLPENVPLYPDLRVEEYLRYRAALKGVPRKQQKSNVERAMERAGVLDVRNKLVGHVSRGYRQRTGLADAMVANPPILILDEPTSGLDPNQRRRIKALVKELAQEHTILFSSHILAEVQDVSSRILVIHRGRMRADGTADQLVAQSTERALMVEAHAPAAALQQALVALPFLRGATAEDVGDGLSRLRAQVDPLGDPRDATMAALAQRGIAVRELRLDMPTLEEFFYRVTEGADRAEEGVA